MSSDSSPGRIILKLSGEFLAGDAKIGIDPKRLSRICGEIAEVKNIQIGIVIGGGNIFRGLSASQTIGFDRVNADYMGMLATMINAIALHTEFSSQNVKSKIYSALSMPKIAVPFHRDSALADLEQNQILIFAGGTGNPFFSTDTCAALRAAEIQADCLYKGTQVDGVYDKDPKKFTDATKFDKLTFSDAIAHQLRVMDLTALTMCQDNQIPIQVFNISKRGNFKKALADKTFGTTIQGR